MHSISYATKTSYTPTLEIDKVEIEKIKEFNFLGIVINEQLNWKSNVEYISCKIARTNGIINRLKHYLPYKAFPLQLIGLVTHKLWHTGRGT